MHLTIGELFGQRAICGRRFAEDYDTARFLIQPMNDGERGPARFAMPQPIVDALACVRTGRVRVHAGGFVDHQQMLVFEDHARQHASMKTGKKEIRKAGMQEPEPGFLGLKSAFWLVYGISGEGVGESITKELPNTLSVSLFLCMRFCSRGLYHTMDWLGGKFVVDESDELGPSGCAGRQ